MGLSLFMPKENLISFLDKESTPDFDGIVHYKNPKSFTGRVPSYADYVVSDDPEIVRVYVEKGVKEYDVQTTSKRAGSAGSTSTRAEPTKSTDEVAGQHSESEYSEPAVRDGKSVDNDGEELQKEKREKEEVEIPEDWESLPFFSQKSIASKLTDEKVRTKDDVQRVIREHLE